MRLTFKNCRDGSRFASCIGFTYLLCVEVINLILLMHIVTCLFQCGTDLEGYMKKRTEQCSKRSNDAAASFGAVRQCAVSD